MEEKDEKSEQELRNKFISGVVRQTLAQVGITHVLEETFQHYSLLNNRELLSKVKDATVPTQFFDAALHEIKREDGETIGFPSLVYAEGLDLVSDGKSLEGFVFWYTDYLNCAYTDIQKHKPNKKEDLNEYISSVIFKGDAKHIQGFWKVIDSKKNEDFSLIFGERKHENGFFSNVYMISKVGKILYAFHMDITNNFPIESIRKSLWVPGDGFWWVSLPVYAYFEIDDDNVILSEEEAVEYSTQLDNSMKNYQNKQQNVTFNLGTPGLDTYTNDDCEICSS